MKLLVLLGVAGIAVFAQTVEGVVTNTGTGAGIAGVQVTLESPRHSYKTTTDPRGAFRFDNIPAGEYTPKYVMQGYVSYTRANSAVHVGGAGTVRADATMAAMGKISGRVLDLDGAGVPNAPVNLSNPRGITTIETDAKGLFTFEQLPPGPYTLDARPPQNYKELPALAGQRRGYAQTFYPGTPVRSGASRIDVRAGSEMWDIDIELMAAPIYRLKGRVLDARGDPFPRATVSLGDPGAFLAKEQKVTAGEDGSFEFPSLTEGNWRVSAEADSGGTAVKAFQTVMVGGRDIDRLELRLTPPFSIHGVVSMEGPDGKRSERKPTLVVLGPAAGGSVAIVQGKPDDTGRFTVDGIYPGPYNVLPVSPGAPFYLASIRLGDRDALDGRVELLPGSPPLTVTYKSDGGAVRGKVEQCGDAWVVLTPQDPDVRRRPEFTYRARCADDGRYEITAIRPGEYYGLAIQPDDPAFRFLMFDLDQHLVNQAARVSVQPNQATMTDLKVMASQ